MRKAASQYGGSAVATYISLSGRFSGQLHSVRLRHPVYFVSSVDAVRGVRRC